MKCDVVYLYYPNEWRRVAGTIFSGSKFNWFLCSFRMFDSHTGLYYISVSPNVQFYCPSTGRSLAARGENRPQLIILDSCNRRVLTDKYGISETDIDAAVTKAQDIGFDGVVLMKSNTIQPDIPFYQGALFFFRKDILTDLSDISPLRCGIIRYAKKNNSRLRELVPIFPTCADIDEALENHPCRNVSRSLYEYITNVQQ